MNVLFRFFIFVAIFSVPATWADDSDSNFGSIKKIDLSDEAPQAPDHLMITMNLNKVKPGMLGQVILYQFSKRVRLEFEAGGLPKGEYALAVATKCSNGDYKKGWTEVHRFTSNSAHIQTEKSIPKASLEAKPGFQVLTGKFLGLFRMKPQLLIDCQPIK